MLVLTRKLTEKLFIGDDICVTVVRLEGGQVRLGIDAPREVTVVRAELVPDRVAARPKALANADANTNAEVGVNGNSIGNGHVNGNGNGGINGHGNGSLPGRTPAMHSH